MINKMEWISNNKSNKIEWILHLWYHKCKLLLNISEKMNLKRSHKYVPLSNLSIYYKWRNFKKSYKNLK